MFNRQDAKLALGTTGVIVLILMFLGTCIVIGFGAYTFINVHFNQPLNRQNINNNAARRIQVEQQYRQLYNDFEAAHERIPVDEAAIQRYEHDNGAPATYTWTQQQAFNQLEITLNGDYQAEVRLANDYNVLAADTDTGRFLPGDLPQSLTPDSQTR